jgi:hypothetical protein
MSFSIQVQEESMLMARSRLAVGLLVGLALSTAGKAAVIIDSFTSTTRTWPLTQSTVGATGASEFLSAGLARGVQLTNLANDIPGLDNVQTSIYTGSGGVLDYNSTSDATGRVNLTYLWSAVQDFQADPVLKVDFIHYDAPGNWPMPMHATVTLGDSTAASFNSSTSSAGSQTVSFDLSSLGSFGLANIQKIEIEFDAPTAADFRLSLVYRDTPEPATAAVLLSGAAGLLVRRRARRASAGN